MSTKEDFKELLADPRIQAILDDLKYALPIVLEMATEKGIEVLNNLLTPESRDIAIEEIKATATPEQWAAFCEDCIARGNADAIKAVADRDFLRDVFVQLVIGVSRATSEAARAALGGL